MTEYLIVDTASLRGLGTDLTSIATTLDDADADADALAAVVPHPGLAGVVREFATGWDRRRGELTEQVKALAERTTGVADTFEALDLELATSIEVEGS